MNIDLARLKDRHNIQMGLSVTLLEITPDILNDGSFRRWISDGNDVDFVPRIVPKFKPPTLEIIEKVLETFKDIDVKRYKCGHTINVEFQKTTKTDVIANSELLGEIAITPLQSSDNSDDNPNVNKSTSKYINRFIQELANQCGIYLLVHNGEPIQFFIPQNTD